MKSEKQKLKLLYIEKYMREYTDESHPVSAKRLIAYLSEHGIEAERKSIYSDLEALEEFGLDIVKKPGNQGGYYLASREFELPEVKLLVDLVQSASFITEKKSKELIRKLELLVPHHEAVTLQRQVVVADRNKALNESIYYTVDTIYAAMAENRKVCFQYFEWDEKKKQRLRKDGEFYEVSPWLLTWDDQRYYLIAFDSEAGILKHYRVDKMLLPCMSENERDGRDAFLAIDIASYSRKTFGMFSGEQRTVRMRFDKGLAGAVVDRFGPDVAMRPEGKDYVMVRADISVSPKFYGWLCGFGDRVQLVSPKDVVEDYSAYLEQMARSMREMTVKTVEE